MLKEYYKEVKNIVEETTAISQTEQEEFLVGAEQYISDLENERCTILIAGETSAGKSSLINLLLNDNVLPTCIKQNTHTICEISYGPTKEAVIHFFDTSKPPRILDESKFAKIKRYIEKPVQNEPWCQRIEIKIPNLLLKGGVVIVDSPGIGDTEQVNKIALAYLPQACAFIYVLNSSNVGGLQEDRLLRILRKWIKLYNGEERCGITAESALFVCNKWDEVEKQANQTQREDLQKHIIGKLRNYIPDLDERSQLIKMSVLRAAEIQKRFHVMSDDLKCLINRLQRLLPLCIEKNTEYLYNWISGQLCTLSHQLKCAMRNAKRNGQERLKVREELKVKLEKLKQGILIQEIEDAISNHVRNLCERITSYMKSDEVRRRFCTWEENDLPCNDRHKTDATKIRETYIRYIEERFLSFIYKWESNERLFAKAYADLDRRFHQSFYDLEKDIRDIDRVLVGDSAVEIIPCETRPTKKFLVITLGMFMPVLIPVGLAAGVLFAPVFGYLLIDRHLRERQLMNNRSQALTELSARFLEVSIDDQVLHHVRHNFSDEMTRITRVKSCHQKLIARYEQRCQDLTSNEDDSRDKETLKKNVPLCEKLQEMNEKLTFDAIQNGIQVMHPPCQINNSRLRYSVRHILGRGSYGTVFKGQFNPPGHGRKEVAVKKLKEAMCPSNVVTFLEEAATLNHQLKHKHIIAFYGVAIEVDNHKWLSVALVFELCPGSLKAHIFGNDSRIPWKTPNAATDTFRWMREILDALEFIHSKNIAHRDLKLDNILISRRNRIKVADLGLAKLKDRITGTVCGTMLYMAPEVHEGKPYCTMADMYSFGLVMWEMWFGKRVFSELRFRSLGLSDFLRGICEGNYRPQIPKSDSRFNPNLPPTLLTKLMTSCWQTEPSKRTTATECKAFINKIERQYVK